LLRKVRVRSESSSQGSPSRVGRLSWRHAKGEKLNSAGKKGTIVVKRRATKRRVEKKPCCGDFEKTHIPERNQYHNTAQKQREKGQRKGNLTPPEPVKTPQAKKRGCPELRVSKGNATKVKKRRQKRRKKRKRIG